MSMAVAMTKKGWLGGHELGGAEARGGGGRGQLKSQSRLVCHSLQLTST